VTDGFLCLRDWLTILPLPWGEGEGISTYPEIIFGNQSRPCAASTQVIALRLQSTVA